MSRRALGFVIVVAALALILLPGQALAWSNGTGNGIGAHRWLLYHADMMALAQGATFVSLGAAQPMAVYPDTVIKDMWDHNYNRWHGQHDGHAERRVATYYNRAVSYLRKGDKRNASKMVGLMSHYYSDVCQPMHTQKWNSVETPGVHTAYEHGVDVRVSRTSSNKKWVHYDGYVHVDSASKFTVAAAKASHPYYRRLLLGFIRHGFNSDVRTITSRRLDYAANGITDLIMSIEQDAVLRSKSPAVPAHVGVASDGTNYYAIDHDSIVKYNASWHSVATTSDLTAGLEETITPRVAAGCVVGNRLYIPVNDSAQVGNVHVLVFDTATLQRVASIATSATADISAIAFVPGGAHGYFYAFSPSDRAHLSRFDASTWSSLGSLSLRASLPAATNGLAYRSGVLYAATPWASGLGRIYRIDLAGHVTLVFTSGLHGVHRGIAFRGADLLWLVDAGASNSHIWTARLL